MHHKFNKVLLALLFSLPAVASEAVYPPEFENEALGKCFTNTSSFIQNTLGNQAISDPNIKQTQKGAWIWIVDQTSSKNYTWYLLNKKNSKICLRAYVPAANLVRFHSKTGVLALEAFISPEADLPGKFIEFVPDSTTASYYPATCYLLEKTTKENIPQKRLISCRDILD